jgi:hypothetical protein
MKFLNNAFGCTILATIACRAHGFGVATATGRPSFAKTTPSSRGLLPLFGLLDDMMNEKTNNSDDDVAAGTVASAEYKEYEEFFQNLIFSAGDIRNEIADQMDACTKPEFLQYLTTTMESSDDDEERQGYQDLLNMIDEVQNTKAEEDTKEQEVVEAKRARLQKLEEEAAAASAEFAANNNLSDSELVKRANAIDQAFTQAELSDDEKPSDFISDCREVVNLSRSFNNNGKMSVGGQ